MITFTMRREGQFVANFTSPSNQCGTGGQQVYQYVCEIKVGESLDERGFILDNYRVQGYFDREYKTAQPAQSCERIAQLATSHFVEVLKRNGRDVRKVSVTIAGSEFAGLTATWEPEPIKIIEFDGKAAEQRVFERIVNDPATQFFGRSLIEIHQALNFYDQAHAPTTLTPVPKPEELLCDSCKQPVELDGGNMEYGGGREDYRHKNGRYSCDTLGQATVNGQDHVIKKVAA